MLIQESPSCSIYNETTMVCHSPPWNAVSVPAYNYIRLKNRFGPFMIYCLNNDLSVLNITILEDPVLDNLTETLHISKRHSRVRLTVSTRCQVSKLQCLLIHCSKYLKEHLIIFHIVEREVTIIMHIRIQAWNLVEMFLSMSYWIFSR